MPVSIDIFVMSMASLAGLAIVAFAGLAGWRDWLALQQAALQQTAGLQQTGLQQAAPRSGAGVASGPPTPAERIEIADLKERIRKLEAIASGVDLLP